LTKVFGDGVGAVVEVAVCVSVVGAGVGAVAEFVICVLSSAVAGGVSVAGIAGSGDFTVDIGACFCCAILAAIALLIFSTSNFM